MPSWHQDYPDSPDAVVTAVRRMPAADARARRCRPASTRASSRRCTRRGIANLYTHQAEAVAHALAGRNVVVTTPTASGKTLCYNVPVLNAS